MDQAGPGAESWLGTQKTEVGQGGARRVSPVEFQRSLNLVLSSSVDLVIVLIMQTRYSPSGDEPLHQPRLPASCRCLHTASPPFYVGVKAAPIFLSRGSDGWKKALDVGSRQLLGPGQDVFVRNLKPKEF